MGNPCQRCGACCAMFHVTFPEAEADNLPGGIVPEAMTQVLKGHRRVMKGTAGRAPKCIALAGTIGASVRCSIYENRPSICRDFSVSWKNGRGNPLCDRARAVYGLPPFSP